MIPYYKEKLNTEDMQVLYLQMGLQHLAEEIFFG